MTFKGFSNSNLYCNTNYINSSSKSCVRGNASWFNWNGLFNSCVCVCAYRCVLRYTAHVNQSQASVLASFSPCSRYLATCSEDNSAYIYDLRGSSPLHRLSGHSDTVTAVAFHPLKPLVSTYPYSQNTALARAKLLDTFEVSKHYLCVCVCAYV